MIQKWKEKRDGHLYEYGSIYTIITTKTKITKEKLKMKNKKKKQIQIK